MNSNLIFIIVIFLIFINSCTESKKTTSKENSKNTSVNVLNDNNEWFYNQNVKYEKEALKAIYNGNNELYWNSSNWFVLKSNKPQNLLYYSNVMALQYKNPMGYYDIFYIHSKSYKNIKTGRNNEYYNYILYNLAKSKELGQNISKEVLGNDTITSNNLKSSEYYLQKAFPDYNITKKK